MSLKRALGLVVVLTLAACRSSTIAVAPEPVAVPAMTAAEPLAKPEAPEAPASELTELVESLDSSSFVHLPGGPVLVVDHLSRAIYETAPDGSMHAFAPFGTYVAEHARAFLPIAHVAGVWPAMMNVELLYMSRTEVSSESFAVDIAKGKTRSTGKKVTVTAAMPWKDGRILAFATQSGSYFAGDEGKFYVASGPPAAALPKLPKETMFSGDFVAYPSGVIFVPAQLPVKEGVDADEGDNVFLFADGIHPTPQHMPASVSGVVRGRVAEETLVYGEHFVRRYDGTGWADIALPSKEAVRALIVDDEGTAWISFGTKLFHGALPSPRWTELAMPPGLVAADLAATTSRDLWVRSENGAILHRGPLPAGPRFQPAGSQDQYVAELTKDDEPHPFFDACQIPLVVLGDAAGTTQAAAEASVKRLGMQAVVVEGKLGGATMRGIEPVNADWLVKDMGSKVRKALPALQKQYPQARLVCGRMVQDWAEKQASAAP